MADYRLRHNIDVGSVNRYGKVHKGHYEPWLTQHINDLRAFFGLHFTYQEPGVHEHATTHVASFGEKFGISPLPSEMMASYGIEKYQRARCQGAAHAILPVHTKEEITEFDKLLREHFRLQVNNNQQPNYKNVVEASQRSADRKRHIPDAQTPSPLKVPRLQMASNIDYQHQQNIIATTISSASIPGETAMFDFASVF
ncbi:hypothetical protein BDB00DRAFT_868067 [Zychaea mexicana]|uniref:uncharacterized protein n=1 Tax=Zychaea mexicana TaxID=64656 RepID=UPI0022FDE3AC|nr:uncharacterized protein BDB00DRAFT_868067 [Zychaea mexicana]KAI9497935.1 hypothetical protein BDB00DRAFT_868067 [Zychaea mexicana]